MDPELRSRGVLQGNLRTAGELSDAMGDGKTQLPHPDVGCGPFLCHRAGQALVVDLR
jgi:hypothetical protein